MAAFALTAAADRTGDPALIEQVGMAVRDAVSKGLDIGRPEVVQTVAARFGLTLGRRRHPSGGPGGLRRGQGAASSAPHFHPHGSWFCPGLAISRDDVGNFLVAWKEGNQAFVDSVFSADD